MARAICTILNSLPCYVVFLQSRFRILWRNKITTFVNIFGLSVGMATFVFIMLYVHHETSYDKFNANYDRIYRLEGDGYGKFPPVIGDFVRDRLPEVENIARLAAGFRADFYYSPPETPTAVKHVEANHFYADSTVFEVFTFPFVQGDSRSALRSPMTAVLTESIAKKLFGDTDPMMKTMRFDEADFMVTGIIKDVTDSHVEIDVLLSMASMSPLHPHNDINRIPTSSLFWSATYLLMTDDFDKNGFEKKLNKTLSEINDGKLIDYQFREFHIKEFSELYFNGVVQNLPYGLHGNLNAVRTFVIIAIFMLLLAGINYINLTTARSTIRAKEIAVKRVTGSSANQLRFQLIVESVIVSSISLIVAMTFVQLLMSTFNQLTGVNLQITDLIRPAAMAMIGGGGLLIGILAGLYPAFYLTSIQPVKLIKGEGIRGSGATFFRSGLMTFQFALSMVMIVAIIVNFRQLQYLRNADLGFNKEQILTIITPDYIKDELVLRETFKERLLQHSGIEGVTNSFGNPGRDLGISGVMEINHIRKAPMIIYVDADYVDVMGIEIIEGKNYPKGGPVGSSSAAYDVLVNESLVKEFGLIDPVGQRLFVDDRNGSYATIIGVVKDFHYASLHDKIKPVVLPWIPVAGNITSIKINAGKVQALIKVIEAEWKVVWGGKSDKPFNYKFLDETMDRQYKSDEQLSVVIGYFTVLALIIACLGLFALSSCMV
ncbi:MAG: ABC transporter permease, partial [Chryseolinea sp.]